jgi:hypothetical protein
MSAHETVRGYRVGSRQSGYPIKDYVYKGTVPLEKDPEVAKSYGHGNPSAARLHYLRGEKRCDECVASERLRDKARRAKRKAAKQAAKEET